MSAEVEQRIAELVAPPYTDPYGNPIPGLDELGITEGTPVPRTPALLPLGEVEIPEGGARLLLDRIGERAQSDVALLAELAEAGIRAGTEVRAEDVAGQIRLSAQGRDGVIIPGSLVNQLTVATLD